MNSLARKGLLAAAVALVTVLASLMAVPRAATAETGAPLTFDPVPGGENYRLTINPDTAFHQYGAAIRAAESTGAVSRVTPQQVATQHDGRSCRADGVNGIFEWNAFCWNQQDNTTSAWVDATDATGGWHPQGLTASHDAQPGGTVGGRHLYIASWYYGWDSSGPPEPEPYFRDQYGRVSIVDSTGTSWKYGHVLLVEPKAGGDFTAVRNIHADGVTWYGNKLYVANGGELQVYDTQFIWRMSDTTSMHTGISGGSSSARKHTFAMPLVAKYRSGNLPNGRSCNQTMACLSSLSLERSAAGDFLVSGEHLTGHGGRVFRWPLNPATDLPRADNGATVGTTSARDAHYIPGPVRQLQGAATDGHTFYLAATCPMGYMGDTTLDQNSYSCIYKTRPGGAATVLTRSPKLTQNLSYSPSSRRLWGMNEKTGVRAVFSIIPTEAEKTVRLQNDYSRLCAGAGNQVAAASHVIQWSCTSAQDERWMFHPTTDNVGGEAFYLRNEYSNLCMGVASSLVDGAGVIQWPCSGAIDEKWWRTADGKLINVYSGRCLALGATATAGTQLIQWPCNSAPDMVWNILPRVE